MKFKKEILQFFDNIKQIKRDRDNRKAFLVDIQQEIQDPTSTFNNFKLKCNDDYTKISCITSIPENYQIASSDAEKYRKIQENIYPINKYLINELNWGEYFVVPDIYYIEQAYDPEDQNNNNISCSYIVSWQYSPVLNKYPNFKYQLAAFISINSILLGALIASLIILL